MLVRTDLPPEQQLVQAVHAAYESGLHLATPPEQDVDYSVVCAVDSEQELVDAHERLKRHGVRSVLFRDSDIDTQATALCTEPISGEKRRLLSKYQLWRAPAVVA